MRNHCNVIKAFAILTLSLLVLTGCGSERSNSSNTINSNPPDSSPTPSVSVTYNGNGNTEGIVPVDSANYQQGQTVTVLGNTGNLTKTGYSFNGWNTLGDGTGTAYTQGQTFTIGSANVTLYATWSANPPQTHSVTYNGNGNTGGIVPADSANYQQGQTVTVLGNTGNLTKTGYSFNGWNTLGDGTGTTYTQGQTFMMGSANVTLYARWAANVSTHVLKDSYQATSGLVGGPGNGCGSGGQFFDEEIDGVLVGMRVNVTGSYTIEQLQLQMSRCGNPSQDLIVAIFSHDPVNDSPKALVGSWSKPVNNSQFTTNFPGDLVTFTGLSAPVTPGTYWIVVTQTGTTCTTTNSGITCSCSGGTCSSAYGNDSSNLSYCTGTNLVSWFGNEYLQPGLTAWWEKMTVQVNYWLYN